MKVKNYILHIGLTLLGIMIPFGSLHADDAEGYPMQTMQWGEVTAAQRSVIERLMADLTLVPASDDTHAVWMGRFEVTQNAWRAVTGDSTRWDALAGDSLPAHTLSWNEAKQFIMALRHLTGKHFRMPTLQEWQFAAKGGQTNPYAGSDKLDKVGWYKDNCNYIIHGVGQKQPNGYGLYDMCGNAPEWCAPADGTTLMPLCGGSYWMDEAQCTVDAVCEQTSTSATGGLRLVLDPINEAEHRVLVVTLADGTQDQFLLSQQPKVTIEAPNLYVNVNGEKHEYDLKQMARMHYVKAAAAARAKAPEEPIDVEGRPNAVYVFRNDDDFNAFLNIDVDSITFSRFGLDNLEYSSEVVQEVWTPDSVYRIPLAAVDSIGFHTPSPKYKSDVFHITEAHLPYITGVDSLSVMFSPFTPQEMLPQIGQVMISDVYGEFIESGFAGRVKEIRNRSLDIEVICNQVGLNSVFDEFLYVGRTVYSDETSQAGVRRKDNSDAEMDIDELSLSIGKISFSYKDLLKNEGLLPKDSEVDMDISLSANPTIALEYVIALNVKGVNNRIRLVPKLLLDSDVDFSIKKTLFKNDKESSLLLFDKKFIPLSTGVPGLYAKIKWGMFCDFSGSVSINGNIKFKNVFKIGFDSNNEGWEKFVCNIDGSEIPESHVSIGLKGSIAVGPAAQLVVCFVTDDYGFPYVKYTVKPGLEIAGNFTISDDAITSEGLSMYEGLKKTKITIAGKMKVEGNAEVLGESWSLPSYELAPDFLKKEYCLFPDFTAPNLTPTEPYFPAGALSPVPSKFPPCALYTVPSNDVIPFIPMKIGIGMFDEAGNKISDQFAEPLYQYEKDWKEQWATFDLSKLTPGNTYVFNPIMRPWNLEALEVKGTQKSVFTIPASMSLGASEKTVHVGKTSFVEIIGGWGQYELTSDNPKIAKPMLMQIAGNGKANLMITGVEIGKTQITVKDLCTDVEKTIDVIVKGSEGDLELAENAYEMQAGDEKSIAISNGSGDYSATSSDATVTTAHIEENCVIVNMLENSSGVITVKDNVTGATAKLDIMSPIPENTYAMKYWFDDQKELAGTVESLAAIQDLDVSGLSDGLHALHVTVCEDFEYLGHYETAPKTVYFLKEGQKTDVVYDYYVDGNKLMDSRAKTENEHTTYLPMQAIGEGLHHLTTVATLAGTAQTAVHNDFFVRANNNNEEAGMRLTVSIDDGTPTTLNRPLQDGSLSYDLDIKGLAPGLHRLNYQIASNGTKGVNTPPRTAFFLVEQKLDGYEYLLNGDETTTVKVGNLHADSPYELVTDLPVQPMPVRSSKFHFAVENDEPCIYGITDLNIRINDEFGAHADSTVEFIDVNVRQPLQNVTMLEKSIPVEVSAPGENVIRWFSLNAHRGDGIRLEASRPCTLQLFAPDGKELYNVSGSDATATGEVNGRLTGTYYVALHDMGNEGDETVALTWNTGNSILTQPVIASPGSNTVYKGTELNLSCATEDADIWYSTDGSRPTPESSRTHKYESSFVVNDEMVLRAIATNKDMLVSDETAYRINIARLDRQQQLMKGWNWISANSTSGDPMDVMTFLQPLEGSVQRILSQTEDLFNDPQYGMIGNLSEVNTLEGYHLQLTEDKTYSWTGIASLPSLRPLQLHKGWNWIGFLPAASMTPDMAFADFTPTEGDCVVGKTGFSTYTDGQWKGTLTSMVPGHAYHYFSAVTTPMTYTDELPNDNSVPRQTRAASPGRCPWQYDVYTYPDVTPVIAQLEPNGVLVSTADCMVGAFCGDECRGVGCLVDGMLFISIHASAAETSLINFRAFDSTTEQEIAIDEYLVADGQLHGSVSQPLILHAINGTPASMPSQTAGQGRNTFDIYSLTGILVRRNATSLKGLKPGVYIINGQKVRL